MCRLVVRATYPERLLRGPTTLGKLAMKLCAPPQVLLALFLSMLLAQAEGKEFAGEGNSKLGRGKALGLKGLKVGEAGATGGLKEGRLSLSRYC